MSLTIRDCSTPGSRYRKSLQLQPSLDSPLVEEKEKPFLPESSYIRKDLPYLGLLYLGV